MSRMTIVLILMCATGCTSWPKEGRGGWAEVVPSNYKLSPAKNSNDPSSNLAHEFEHLSLKLDLLKTRGISQCMPARLHQVELVRTRVQRTMAAELYSDAQIELRILYHQLNQLDKHFERVTRATGCASNQSGNPSEALRTVEQLLNSDNQFAFNSSEVTPKYQTRLAKASELLQLLPDINILLVGHTDSQGRAHINFELALQRAESVKQWLVMYGVDEAQVETLTQGASTPFSDNPESDEKRHSDRRVNAYVIAKGDNSEASKMMKIKRIADWTNSLNSDGGKP